MDAFWDASSTSSRGMRTGRGRSPRPSGSGGPRRSALVPLSLATFPRRWASALASATRCHGRIEPQGPDTDDLGSYRNRRRPPVAVWRLLSFPQRWPSWRRPRRSRRRRRAPVPPDGWRPSGCRRLPTAWGPGTAVVRRHHQVARRENAEPERDVSEMSQWPNRPSPGEFQSSSRSSSMTGTSIRCSATSASLVSNGGSSGSTPSSSSSVGGSTSSCCSATSAGSASGKPGSVVMLTVVPRPPRPRQPSAFRRQVTRRRAVGVVASWASHAARRRQRLGRHAQEETISRMAGSLTASRRPSSNSRRTPRQRVRQRQTLSEPIASAVTVTERSRPSLVGAWWAVINSSASALMRNASR